MGWFYDFLDDLIDKVNEKTDKVLEKVDDKMDAISDFVDDLHYGDKKEAFKTAAREGVFGLTGKITVGIVDWINESSSVSGRITHETASAELGRRIKENLDSGNYNTFSLKATVADIQEQSGTTYVCFEVENDKYGLKSTQGTDLHVNDVLTLY